MINYYDNSSGDQRVGNNESSNNCDVGTGSIYNANEGGEINGTNSQGAMKQHKVWGGKWDTSRNQQMGEQGYEMTKYWL
jgi:hypothetical protein